MLRELLRELQSDESLSSLGQAVGATSGGVATALSSVVPMLVGAMGRNAASSTGADALISALDRDHDGSILDDLVGFLGTGGSDADGDGILGHLLGSRRPAVEKAVSHQSGVSAESIGRLLSLVAPLVMAWLGRQRRQGGVGRGNIAGALSEQLGDAGAPLNNLLAMLDQDGDGEIGDDLARLLASLFR